MPFSGAHKILDALWSLVAGRVRQLVFEPPLNGNNYTDLAKLAAAFTTEALRNPGQAKRHKHSPASLFQHFTSSVIVADTRWFQLFFHRFKIIRRIFWICFRNKLFYVIHHFPQDNEILLGIDLEATSRRWDFDKGNEEFWSADYTSKFFLWRHDFFCQHFYRKLSFVFWRYRHGWSVVSSGKTRDRTKIWDFWGIRSHNWRKCCNYFQARWKFLNLKPTTNRFFCSFKLLRSTANPW